MPNQPRPDNPPRTVRVDDALWLRACEAALDREVSVSSLVRDALAAYLEND